MICQCRQKTGTIIRSNADSKWQACMHACHFESELDLIMVPVFWSSWIALCLDVEDKMLLEYDDSLDATRRSDLSIVQVIVFPFWSNCAVSPFSTHMNIRALSKVYVAKESLAFHRVIALLLTDRNHEQKLVLTRSFALSPDRGKSHMGFWTFSNYPLYLSSILLSSALCTEAPESTKKTNDLPCLWRLHKRINRSLLRLWACIFSCQIPRNFAGTTCLSWGFLRWLFLKTGRARISLTKFHLFDLEPRHTGWCR